jgi:N utilization substance protein A
VIVPDFQLSLAIGKEGQNARLAARLTGWRVDIKSETQFADEEAGIVPLDDADYAEGEWVANAETGEMEWHPAEGGEAITANQWEHAGEEPEATAEDAPADDAAPAAEDAAPEAAEAAPEAEDAAPEAAEAAPEAEDAAPEADAPVAESAEETAE